MGGVGRERQHTGKVGSMVMTVLFLMFFWKGLLVSMYFNSTDHPENGWVGQYSNIKINRSSAAGEIHSI